MSAIGIPATGIAKAAFTKELSAIVNIMPPTSSYLLSDFKQQYNNTVFASWQKRMWGEQANTTVLTGADGQLVKVPQFTEKVDQPPQQHVYFNINTLYSYNTAFGSINPSQSAIDTFMEEFAIQMQACKDRFVRTYSKMAIEAMLSGTITTNTFNYDFSRLTQSNINLGSGNYWDNDAVAPTAVLIQAAQFIRNYGKVGANEYDVILGTDAIEAFYGNDKTLNRSQKLWSVLDNIQMPKTLTEDGEIYHGTISAAGYRYNLYTYAGVYTADQEYQPDATVITNYGTRTQTATANSSTMYMPANKIIVKPSRNVQALINTLVDRLPAQVDTNSMLGSYSGLTDNGMYYMYDFVNMQRNAWEFHIKSNGMPVLLRQHNYFTAQVLGD